MRKLCVLLAVLLALPLMAGYTEEAAYEGYLVKMRPGSWATLSEQNAILEPVWEDIYRVEDADAVRQLREAGLVWYAEPDYLVELDELPDDPKWTNGEQYVPELIGLSYAWSAGFKGTSVRVGIVDSGLYARHEDLSWQHLSSGWNYCDNNDNVTDEVGHGTFVAGVIAAQTGNGLGVTGIAPEVDLIPLKCFNARTGRISDIVKAIEGGVNEFQCDVLNLSFGLAKDSQPLREAVEYAASRNVLMVAATGNLSSGVVSTGNDPLNYPAAYDCVVGVGAVDGSGTVAAFSYQNSSVWVCAPGANVVSLGTSARNHYRTGSGTSYAAPVVTAMAALALDLDPGLSHGEFQDLLRDTAEDRGEAGYDRAYGYGLVNVERFLVALRNSLDPDRLYGYVSGLEPGAQVQVMAACYRADGKMLDMSTRSFQADEDGAVCVDGLPILKAAVYETRMIALDENLCPVGSDGPAVYRWTQEETEE